MNKILILSLVTLILSACGGGGNSNEEKSEIELLSPKTNVNYSHTTLEINNNVSDIKTTIDGTEYIGIKNTNSFFIYNVPLKAGSNEIQLVANNGSEKLTITVNSQAQGIAPIALELDQVKGFGSLTINAKVNSRDLTILNYLLDNNNNGVIDTESSVASFQLQYDTIGSYSPKITVRTSDNILYTVPSNQTVNIIENPLKNIQNITGITNVQDLEQYANFIYALSDSTILKISQDDFSNTETITVSGLSGAKGFTLDNDGNIFIADTGNDRILKLLAVNNYQVDTSFTLNTSGSNKGEMLTPADVSTSGVGTNIKVFVLDAGNNRVQVFNHVGAYLADFDGSTTAQGKLNNPLNMIGAPNVVITDKGNGILREITYNEALNSETGRVLFTLADFGKVTYSSDGLLLPDNTNKQFVFMNITGKVDTHLPTTSSNLIAMAYEQNHQLLQVKDGSNIEHIFIPKTSPEVAPKALAQNFVQAYLGSDDTTMLTLTSKSNIDKLKEIDTKVREAFNGMTSYGEQIYMNGLKAVVNGKTTVPAGEVIIKFYFNWTNEKWSLTEIL